VLSLNELLFRKNRNKSANRGPADPHGFNPPASPMDTWTAERPFAQINILFSSAKNEFFADENKTGLIWTVIRSAVLYSA
jgi:hypothetical protein